MTNGNKISCLKITIVLISLYARKEDGCICYLGKMNNSYSKISFNKVKETKQLEILDWIWISKCTRNKKYCIGLHLEPSVNLPRLIILEKQLCYEQWCSKNLNQIKSFSMLTIFNLFYEMERNINTHLIDY